MSKVVPIGVSFQRPNGCACHEISVSEVLRHGSCINGWCPWIPQPKPLNAALPDNTVRLSADNLKGLALARNNGRVCAETGLSMRRSNPYRKGSGNHAAFVEGFSDAIARATKPIEGTGNE